jgi:hypothetical protein
MLNVGSLLNIANPEWFGEFPSRVTIHVIDSARPVELRNLFGDLDPSDEEQTGPRVVFWDDGHADKLTDERVAFDAGEVSKLCRERRLGIADHPQRSTPSTVTMTMTTAKRTMTMKKRKRKKKTTRKTRTAMGSGGGPPVTMGGEEGGGGRHWRTMRCVEATTYPASAAHSVPRVQSYHERRGRNTSRPSPTTITLVYIVDRAPLGSSTSSARFASPPTTIYYGASSPRFQSKSQA